jgi:competence protein ComEA
VIELNWTKREKKIAVAFLVVLLIGFAFFVIEGDSDNKDTSLELPEELQSSETKRMDEPLEQEAVNIPSSIVIDVKGAVREPGVYEMQSNQRVKDVIDKAGGMLENADQRAINLAQLLSDEMVVYIPEIGESTAQVPSVTSNSEQKKGVNINSASVEELQALPGIGPAKAEAIASYRSENGAFQSVDDLLNVSGIGEKSLEKLKEHVKLK